MKSPLGYLEVVADLPIRLKQGGEARLGEVIRPNQQEYLERVRRFRCEHKPIHWIELKVRQFVSMTTIAGSVLAGDGASNAGFNSFVTSNSKDSLAEIDQIFKYFYGKTKDQAKREGRATRFADYQYVSPNGSRVTAQTGTENLGRSGSVTGFLMSEAGYITDWTETWRSIEPSLSDAWWRYVIMETTLRRNQPGDFRDVIEEAADGKYPPWEVHFTSWHANPALAVEMSGKERAEFMEVCPPYEAELVFKHGLTWAQARWYFNKRVGGMFGSYDAMKEAYPTTMAEALESVTSADYFDRNAIKFYESELREPIRRMKRTPSGLRSFEHQDSLMQPHLEVWELPAAHARYRIGADCADSEEREAVEGSENALVVINEDSGDVVAVYHGYCNSHEFAEIIDMTARLYNEAAVVPEHNNAGKAVIDHLRTALQYGNIYKREKFKYGVSIGTIDGLHGFDTRNNTRGILLDRLQLGVNRRLWRIPSQYVLECVKTLGRRNGAKVKRRGSRQAKPDDGAIALALTGFGHSRLVEQVWRPKEPWNEEEQIPVKKKRRGIPIMLPESREPKFDRVWGKWR